MEKGFKGFEKGLVCRGKQYAENTIFEEDDAIVCKKGIHFCKNPLDVFRFYPPTNENGELNEFAEVTPLEEAKTDDDIKFCTKKIKIGAKINLIDFVNMSVDFIKEKSTNTGDWSASTNTGNSSASTNTGDNSASTNTGYSSASTNTGDRSASTNTGDSSASTNTGDWSASTVEGKNSIAIAWGVGSKARGVRGCYLALAEYDNELNFIGAKMEVVDGEKIKENTFYILKNGEFVEEE